MWIGVDIKINIKNLVTINHKEIKHSTIEFTEKTKLWCKLPYPNHPKGCPNYNKNPLCPPISNVSDNFENFIINHYDFFYLLYAVFNFKKYKRNMKITHPDWTERQIGNLLYWQGSVQKLLKNRIKEILHINYNKNIYLLFCGSGLKDKHIYLYQPKVYSMESVGIDVFRVLKNNNIDFELKPKNKVVLVTLICSDIKLDVETK